MRTFAHDDDSAVVIVGSGAGGGTLANELAKKGAQVAQSALSDPRTRSLVGGILGKLLDDD